MKTTIKRSLTAMLAVIVLLAAAVFSGTACFAANVLPAAEDPSFSVEFLDIGQADAALVQCDGHYMLIDGGNSKDSQTMYTVMKTRHVSKLDLVVGTHGDADHIGGIPGALNYAKAGKVICSTDTGETKAFNNFKKAADKFGGIRIPSIGDTYDLGSAKVEIMGMDDSKDTNENSIILKIDYGKTSFIFTGDAEDEAEKAVIASHGKDLKSTVLKVGHHGSRSSTSSEFLKTVSPSYAVISVGKNNSYGHPVQSTLDRLKNAGVKLYRTDLQGDILCTSDGTEVTFTPSKNADADVFKGTEEKVEAPAPTPAPAAAPEAAVQQPSAPAGIEYVANTNTGKFHYASCKHVKTIKDKNRMDFCGSRDELTAQGYVPCKTCNP